MERPILRSIAVSCALAALAGVSAPLDAQDARTAAVREILTLQDQRSVLDGKLVEYLSSPQAELRRRACLALANIQDTTTVPSIIPLLADGSWRVRQAAAYALGQIGSERVWVSLAFVRIEGRLGANPGGIKAQRAEGRQHHAQADRTDDGGVHRA